MTDITVITEHLAGSQGGAFSLSFYGERWHAALGWGDPEGLISGDLSAYGTGVTAQEAVDTATGAAGWHE